jgi:hypothetical protein
MNNNKKKYNSNAPQKEQSAVLSQSALQKMQPLKMNPWQLYTPPTIK